MIVCRPVLKVPALVQGFGFADDPNGFGLCVSSQWTQHVVVRKVRSGVSIPFCNAASGNCDGDVWEVDNSQRALNSSALVARLSPGSLKALQAKMEIK